MKKLFITAVAVALLLSGTVSPAISYGQSPKTLVNKYLTELPHGKAMFEGKPEKYRMTAVYTNRDFYGNFSDKQKITGEYTRGLENGLVAWNNIYISGSKKFSDPFPAGVKQEYMENMRYVPSSKMLDEDVFKNFPVTPENVFARNLIWDMGMIEDFAWDYSDSLKLNKVYTIQGITGDFEMAEIGTYSQISIQICWTGISFMNNKLCAVIEYRALDNKLALNLDLIKSKGTEQYWGTTWIALDDKHIEYAAIYGGTAQEIEVNGLKDKFLMKTIRELFVERIQ